MPYHHLNDSAAVLSVSKAATIEINSNSSGIDSISEVNAGGTPGIIFGSESPVADLKGLNKSKIMLGCKMVFNCAQGLDVVGCE